MGPIFKLDNNPYELIDNGSIQRAIEVYQKAYANWLDYCSFHILPRDLYAVVAVKKQEVIKWLKDGNYFIALLKDGTREMRQGNVTLYSFPSISNFYHLAIDFTSTVEQTINNENKQ